MQRIAIEDRLAIEELVYRYAWASDGRDFRALRALFCDDASFVLHGPDGAVAEMVRGAETIVAWVEQRHRAEFARGDQRRHLTGNFVLDSCDGSRAVARSYLCVLAVSVGQELRASVMGRYEDHLRRLPDGWRFHRRLVFVEGKGAAAVGRASSP